MPKLDPPALFLGDLADPWVRAIADGMPGDPIRIDGRDGLPDRWPDGSERAPLVVVQRGWLTDRDADRLRALKERTALAQGAPARVVLCVGPHARARAADRWATVADVILNEATAAESIGRYLPGRERAADRGRRPRVVVVSSIHDLRRTLVEMAQAAGYPAFAARSWSEAEADPASLAVWDAPVLDPAWPESLVSAARDRRVLALMGFSDRELVSTARACGAAACLDLPVDPLDLAFVLDRMASALAPDPPHATPPRPMGARADARTGGRAARPRLE